MRIDEWKKLGIRTIPYHSVYGLSWEDLAKYHVAARNEAVAYILFYLRMMQIKKLINTHQLDKQSFDVSGAVYQMELPRRLPPAVPTESELTELSDIMQSLGLSGLKKLSNIERIKLYKKCFTTQNAHVLPCQITVQGYPLPRYPSLASMPHMERVHLVGQFSRVERLPMLFNETDSHAERLGLRDAFLKACTGLSTMSLAGQDQFNRQDFLAIKTAYLSYEKDAFRFMNEGAGRQRKLLEKESGDLANLFYRQAKAKLFEFYGKFTESEKPDMIIYENRMQYFAQLWEDD